ncbi:MAG: methyltransferase domain-containing protein [Zoogloeaceae bacterium]|jgi:tRNA (guanine-N7-)-methyltransferase|nr:methyltransferase domain-containing protein [Zoogloeaceae bacterium]
MRARANSRLVTSHQAGPHPDLERTVRRHLGSVFQKPVAAVSKEAFAAALHAWRDWNPAARLILDSGCGIGESAARLARRFPEAFVLGVDQSAHRLARIPRNLPANLAFTRANLVDFWRLMNDEGIRLFRHYLLYPNPWPKQEHLKRRWHGHPCFPALIALGGVLECRSNWRIYVEELALACRTALERQPAVERWIPEEEALTPFERKYQASGHALWRLVVDLDGLET